MLNGSYKLELWLLHRLLLHATSPQHQHAEFQGLPAYGPVFQITQRPELYFAAFCGLAVLVLDRSRRPSRTTLLIFIGGVTREQLPREGLRNTSLYFALRASYAALRCSNSLYAKDGVYADFAGAKIRPGNFVEPPVDFSGSNPSSTKTKEGAQGPFFCFWRRERDSNPRYAINVYTLSRRAP